MTRRAKPTSGRRPSARHRGNTSGRVKPRRPLLERLESRALLAGTILEADFELGTDGFSYRDDAFRTTEQPEYATGFHSTDGGPGEGAALELRLGGINGKKIRGMSGGWQKDFRQDAAGGAALLFRYRMEQSNKYEDDEFAELLVSVDDVVWEVDRVSGGNANSSEWQSAHLDLGHLPAGDHTLVIGGFNNKKTAKNELTRIRIDDVRVQVDSGGSPGSDDQQPRPDPPATDPPPPVPGTGDTGHDIVIDAHFDTTNGGFVYVDDAFRDTSQPRYADGRHQERSTEQPGYLEVGLGGLDGKDIAGMSGGWQHHFELDASRETTTLRVRYRLEQSNKYEDDEYSEVLVGIDGLLLEVERVAGGNAKSADWQTAELELGELEAGSHTLVLGGYNNQKTAKSESTIIRFDSVQLRGKQGAKESPPDDGSTGRQPSTDPHRASVPDNADLALRWAPILYQDVDQTGGIPIFKSDSSLGGKSDYITAIDFDGNWNTLDNWANLEHHPANAHMYYSVTATESHWFILYAFFYPRDWHGEIADEEHENDMEGLLTIVKRPPAGSSGGFGELQGIVTEAHTDFYSYVAPGSPLTSGNESIDGTLLLEAYGEDLHPTVFAEANGHGVYNWNGGDFAGGDGIRYVPTLDKAEQPRGPNDRHVRYKLVDIFAPGGLWSRRLSRETFAEWGKFRGDDGGALFSDGKDKAQAPWVWDDSGFLGTEIDGDGLPPGNIANDPARLADVYFGGEKFSRAYESNPYMDPNTVVYFVNGFFGTTWTDDDPGPMFQTAVEQGYTAHIVNWNSLDHNGFDPLNFPLDDDTFVNEFVETLNGHDDSDTIILVGYSFGGDSLLKVANRTSRDIDLLAVLDPVGPWGQRGTLPQSVPANVRYFYNRWEEGQPTVVPTDSTKSGRLNSHAYDSLRADFGIQDQARIDVSHLDFAYHDQVERELSFLIHSIASPNRLSDQPYVLIPNEGLHAGESIHSADQRFTLAMQADGNLVLSYRPTGAALWSTATHGLPGTRAIMQDDGNFVLYQGNRAVWNSGTYGHHGAHLVLQDDGNLVVYSWNGTPLWDSGTWWSSRIPDNGLHNLVPGETLRPGDSLESRDGRFSLVLQQDGNLVLYFRETWTPLWHTHTFGRPVTHAVMQGDGNFVIYNGSQVVWSPNTYGQGATQMVLQDDGNLVIYRWDGTALWNSGTWQAGAAPGDTSDNLTLGEVLLPGQSIKSSNGRFTLAMQTDGNLVLYAPWAVLWHTGTYGRRVTHAVMQGDGNLVLYDGGHAVWASGTQGHAGAHLLLQDDGNLVLYGWNRAALWHTHTWWAGAVPGDTPHNLAPGEHLFPGQSIRSPNGRFTLAMQTDGNLVLYAPWGALWHTGTYGRRVTHAVMQGDGNLVLYDGGHAVWASGTHGHAGAHLLLQDDGNLVLYNWNYAALWHTHTWWAGSR